VENRIEQIGLNESHAFGNAVTRSVTPRDLEGSWRNIGSGYAGSRQFVG
jgi:hypothetical protein